MKNSDKVQMQVRIAGTYITLSVPFDTQDEVRNTEKSIEDLYNNWKGRFPNKSDETLLAMIAYQYASFYNTLASNNQRVSNSLREIIDSVDEALKK